MGNSLMVSRTMGISLSRTHISARLSETRVPPAVLASQLSVRQAVRTALSPSSVTPPLICTMRNSIFLRDLLADLVPDVLHSVHARSLELS